jgi:cytochrome c-type biogenesis protein CcmH
MKNIIAFIFILFSGLTYAEPEKFISPTQQDRFNQLTHQLRCVVCQNQSLAESNAPLAKDLRNIIANQIQQGADDESIKQFLVNRYSEFILYKPTFEAKTFILWLGPFLALIFGLILLLRIIHKKNNLGEGRA